eukprot:PLAT12268.5.p1 GENE.PLAT12268.5~~PLAT12268.5.p1  ORF type:complete len:232 (-),score=132.35 PLAT12268.5:14-709(-)
MIKTAFRPSDDSTMLPFNIPSNAMAASLLPSAAKLLDAVQQPQLAEEARRLAEDIERGIRRHGIIHHAAADGDGTVYAYEVDGFGNSYFMDDANVPSLLSLPYLGFLRKDDATYLRTRALVLSEANPYFYNGSAGNGTGGPHNGYGYVWPISQMMRALTSTSDAEIRLCLQQLIDSSAGTGFMHESFWLDDAQQYTRPWFAWANSLFGQLILQLAAERPWLIFKDSAPPLV